MAHPVVAFLLVFLASNISGCTVANEKLGSAGATENKVYEGLVKHAEEFTWRRISQALQLAEHPKALPDKQNDGAVLKLMGQYTERGDETAAVDHRTSFIVGEKVGECSRHGWTCFQFKISKSVAGQDILSTESFLHLEVDGPLNVDVRLREGPRRIRLRAFTSAKDVVFNITEAVELWYSQRGEVPFPIVEINRPQEQLTAVLALKTKFRKLLRQKRDIEPMDCDSNGCCGGIVYVNFSRDPFNKIILKPLGYFLKICVGRCKAESSPHSLMKSYSGIVSESCCSPAGFLPLEVTYRLQGDQYVVRRIDDMIVSECKCQ